MIAEEAKSKLRRLMEARTKRDIAKVAFEQAEAEFREVEADVFEALDEVKGQLKTDLGGNWGDVAFRRRETEFGRVYDDEAFQEWLENTGRVDEYSTPKVAKGRLNSLVRSLREQGLELPPGVDFYTNTGVTITRQKGD